jgi:Ca2+-binding RTX toxin-like protein
MKKTLLLILTALLVLPSAASAATADADVKRRGGINVGPVKFTAAKGERNRLTATATPEGTVFRDSSNRVVAKGDCVQVDRHAARCPSSEDGGVVRLGNRDDRAELDTERLSLVSGGSGNDVLRGAAGRQVLSGDRGNDELHGNKGSDELTGGPGRDELYGGSGDDTLFDGETDGQAAADLFRGGSSRDTLRNADRGDTIDYSRRKRGLDIDLSRGKVNFGREGDVIRGLESVRGGSGNDKLSGDGDDNYLEGQGGNDRLRGRGGDDIPMGGNGTDTVAGDDGNDTVWGDAGIDQLSGGAGDDQMIARSAQAETVDCGAGEDVAAVTRFHTVIDCERAGSSQLLVTVQPDIQGNTATFQVACVSERGCSGTISLSSLDGTVAYGSGSYAGIPHGADQLTPVTVELTQDGKQAIQQGDTIQVTFPGSNGGFRAAIGRR